MNCKLLQQALYKASNVCTSGMLHDSMELDDPFAHRSHLLFDFAASIDFFEQASTAAKASNAPLVMQYVPDVQRELHNGSK